MSNKNENSNGPKTDEGKAISSRNSVTHGLTARHWLDTNEQSLYEEIVENLMVGFEPQTYIEKMLITKMAECDVRLRRIQNKETYMFDLASNEAENVVEAIKSLSNGHKLDSRLIDSMATARLGKPTNNPRIIEDKIRLMDEIDYQNLDDVTGWAYVEDNMPTATDYIIKKCTNENLNLFDFISRETDQSKNIGIRLIIEGEDSSDENMSLSIEEIVKGAQKISSYSLQKYLGKLTHSLAKDTQTQFILANLEPCIQQIKDAAMPDTKKLSLIQRYRTADERQFSKTLGELLELQKIRNSI